MVRNGLSSTFLRKPSTQQRRSHIHRHQDRHHHNLQPWLRSSQPQKVYMHQCPSAAAAAAPSQNLNIWTQGASGEFPAKIPSQQARDVCLYNVCICAVRVYVFPHFPLNMAKNFSPNIERVFFYTFVALRLMETAIRRRRWTYMCQHQKLPACRHQFHRMRIVPSAHTHTHTHTAGAQTRTELSMAVCNSVRCVCPSRCPTPFLQFVQRRCFSVSQHFSEIFSGHCSFIFYGYLIRFT